tara:strand:+ start:29488 stop:29841 length:354 start_codon:yes stop_codon:yes gene_type:complete
MIDIILWACTMFVIAYYNLRLSYKISNASLDRITISHKNAQLLSSVFHGSGLAYLIAGVSALIFILLFNDTYVFSLIVELTKEWYITEVFIFYNVIIGYHVRQAYRKFVIHDDTTMD